MRLVSKLIIITFIYDPIEPSRDPHTYQRKRNHAITFQQTAFSTEPFCDPFSQHFDKALMIIKRFVGTNSFRSR